MERHIFRVHSPLTYAMARHIIQTQKIAVDTVLLLLSRGFVPADTHIKTAVLPYSHHPIDSFAAQPLFWKSWSKLRNFDTWLSQLTEGQPFYWYADHAYSSIFHLAVTHALCKGYYYLEEGLVVYRPQAEWGIKKGFNPLRPFLYWLNFGSRNPSQRAYFTTKVGHYLGCYAVTTAAFGTMPNKQVIGNPFVARTFAENYQAIFVHDGMYDAYPKAVYLKWVGAMLAHALSKGYTHLYQKFHPSQSITTKTEINNYLLQQTKDKATLGDLPPSASIEEIAISQQSTVYVCTSSAGVYAHLGGAKVVSLYPLCCADQPDMLQYAAIFPSFYTSNIEYISS